METISRETEFASIANPVGVLTALDPVDGTKLWVSHQWANSAAPCVWNARIVEYQITSGPATQAKPKRAGASK